MNLNQFIDTSVRILVFHTVWSGHPHPPTLCRRSASIAFNLRRKVGRVDKFCSWTRVDNTLQHLRDLLCYQLLCRNFLNVYLGQDWDFRSLGRDWGSSQKWGEGVVQKELHWVVVMVVVADSIWCSARFFGVNNADTLGFPLFCQLNLR